MGEVNLFLAAFAEKLLDLIAPGGKGGGLRNGRFDSWSRSLFQ